MREANLEKIRAKLHVPIIQETTSVMHQFVLKANAHLSQNISHAIHVENPNVQVNELLRKMKI